jgi:uncharacterized protein YajQ (UPF0234 family)
MKAESTFQLQQMLPILFSKLTKRGIDIACLETGDVKEAAKTAQQPIELKEGLEKPLAKKIVKLIKDKKLKVQAAIEGEKIRVSGKKRDDLQQTMHSDLLYLVSSYDGVIGSMVAIWLALVLAAYFTYRHVQQKSVNP